MNTLGQSQPTAIRFLFMVQMGHQRFEELVAEALDRLPEGLARAMNNVAVFVEDRHRFDPALLGLYEGIPLTERDDYGGLVVPDSITLFRLAICDTCSDEAEVREEIWITVVHEIAHHFGIDEARLDELGWS
jgi:predicted Zn-dependent protease with MMP-like domain